jgi:hypothetical protein
MLSTHQDDSPENHQTDNVSGWTSTGERLGDGSENDDDQLETIHFLSADLERESQQRSSRWLR